MDRKTHEATSPDHGTTAPGWGAIDAGGQKHLHDGPDGLTSLYVDPAPRGKALSRWGLEVSFRMAVDTVPDKDAMPLWPIKPRQNLARYIIGSGRWVEPGHIATAHGPIKAEGDTALVDAPCDSAVDGAPLAGHLRAGNTLPITDISRRNNPANLRPPADDGNGPFQRLRRDVRAKQAGP
ncbi:MAG: suppressor of fused domain protein [Pseudomonadota bacterium]